MNRRWPAGSSSSQVTRRLLRLRNHGGSTMFMVLCAAHQLRSGLQRDESPLPRITCPPRSSAFYAACTDPVLSPPVNFPNTWRRGRRTESGAKDRTKQGDNVARDRGCPNENGDASGVRRPICYVTDVSDAAHFARTTKASIDSTGRAPSKLDPEELS